jgi:hypothetical protein
MKKVLASIAVVVLLAVPFGASAHEDAADATIPLTDADASLPTLYVDAESMGIWQESNSDAGLQTVEHTHGDVAIPADTRVA